VCDVPILEAPHEVKLDVIITEAVEQTPAGPEQHLHQVDLHLVQLTGPEERLSRTRAMNHDCPVASSCTRLTGAVVHVGDEPRVAEWHVPVVGGVGQDENRYTGMMVTLPTPGELEGPTAGD
jgi:hypothetical protein